MKVVINRCFGGFGLSPKAKAAYLQRKGKAAFFYVEDRGSSPDMMKRGYVRVSTEEAAAALISHTMTRDLGERVPYDVFHKAQDAYFSHYDVERSDPDLAAAIEELGNEASGRHASLRAVEVPDDVSFEIDDYDGMESIHETHRSWS